MPDEDPRLGLLLALADDELVIGHRHAEWTGWAPYLEEDLAFSSIGQDEMGHARLLYELAEPLAGKDPDSLALGREPGEYRHAILCERPNGDWGYTIARQYLYDTADGVRLAALERSSFAELAAAVKTIRLEERYHLEHARQWFTRFADGPVEARQRFAQGLEAAVGEALALFESLPGEDSLVSDGVLPNSNEELLAEWLGSLGQTLEEASLDWVLASHSKAAGEMVPTSSGEIEQGPTLSVPGIERRDGKWVHVGGFTGDGGRHGRHTADFGVLWDEMTGLYRKIPRSDVVKTATENLERQVQEALEAVNDPEIPACSITDLGMVERTEVTDDAIAVELLPTFIGCPAKDVIEEDVTAALREVAGDREVRVSFLYDSPWTTNRINERGRARLREIGIAPHWERPGGPVTVSLMTVSGVACPFCGSTETGMESAWGPTPCRTQHFCSSCRNPFEGFKEKTDIRA